jgi:hypothetical protein
MRALARDGMTVLTSDGRLRRDGTADAARRVIDVAGMRVAGFSDPLEWKGRDPADPKRKLGFAQMADGDQRRKDAEASLVAWFDGLPERPDLVLVHQNGLAQELARTLNARGEQTPLVILTGHDHKQHVDRHGEIVVADAGSAGAGGLLGVADERVGVGELHFPGAGSSLQSVDLIEVDPIGGGATAERVVVEGRRCEDEADECRLSR